MDVPRALAAALSPVFLITGVAGLLASMNIRFGRVIDRTRTVLREAKSGLVDTHEVDVELRILYRRARLLRATIILSVGCIFAVAVCVFLIFMMTMLGFELPYVIPAIFSFGLVLLLLALMLLMQDFATSLDLLKREMRLGTGRDVLGPGEP
jgi:hypothetical protein